ncbi:B-cell CLL/lymphoma 9-like protein [Ahaetulla prasina]|uniref:B-cell CLL/lymphoma 9-like protein n=1 Tax=Ahaetulla prasina TaxID=499056 RepID=UPI0026490FC3|nr:B-cell CLL/lymphoma 9-like protein [Ahaetulla prasina]
MERQGKVRRERSVSVDSGERREASATPLDKELKGETVPRSKRRCVLERKQPYSGDEWCSGPESEDDDKSLGSSHNCHVAESAMSTGAQLGPGSNPLPALSESNTPGAPHSAAPNLRSDAGGKQSLQLVYVFTTHLANTAAEAVLQGQADSILGYHQQHVPRAKLDQPSPLPKMPGAVEPLPLHLSPANTPQGPPALPPSSQAQGQQAGGAPLGLSQGPLSSSNALPPEGAPEEACQDLTPNSVGNGSNSSSSVAPSSTHPSTPTALSSLQASTAEGLLGGASRSFQEGAQLGKAWEGQPSEAGRGDLLGACVFVGDEGNSSGLPPAGHFRESSNNLGHSADDFSCAAPACVNQAELSQLFTSQSGATTAAELQRLFSLP